MPRKRPSRPTSIARYLIVESWSASVGSHYGAVALGPHSSYLHLYGHLDEPLRNISKAHVQISPDPHWETRTTAGMLIGLKPHAQFVISVPPIEFDRLWQLVLGNACRSIRFVFSEPKWSKATITGWYASTNLPDEDE